MLGDGSTLSHFGSANWAHHHVPRENCHLGVFSSCFLVYSKYLKVPMKSPETALHNHRPPLRPVAPYDLRLVSPAGARNFFARKWPFESGQ